MADQGAEVLKIEPLKGEPLRFLAAQGSYNSGFENFNRGKQSIAIDLKRPESVEIVRKLVANADVIVENFRVGVMNRLGLSYEQCREWNAAIIYCSNSGFGEKGEWADRPSYDMVAQAFTGVLTAMGGGPSHPPLPVEWAFSDEVGALNFYASILAAVIARERTGKGQRVVTSQTGATLYFQRAAITAAVMKGKQRDDGKRPGWAMAQANQILKASDGRYFVVALGLPIQWKRFAKQVLERADLITDERSARGMARLKNKEWLLSEIGGIVAQQPQKHWVAECVKANVPCAPVNSYADIAAEQHFRDNGYIMEDCAGNTIVGPPSSYSETPNAYEKAARTGGRAEGVRLAPRVGQDTETVLHKIGYSAGDVAEFVRSGLVLAAPPLSRAPPHTRSRL
jgi:crotonobetainyl-CoA:carnitine CoA-transferase CaiB-like acyl-CoA transferase